MTYVIRAIDRALTFLRVPHAPVDEALERWQELCRAFRDEL